MGVTVYTKSGCPYCKAAKESFEKQGVAFTEINVSNNPEKIAELEKLVGVGIVPVIVDDSKVTVGFNGGA
jgi:glutaredoxin 3